MKKVILIAVLALLSIAGYSQTRVMTDEERELLRNNPTFTYKCNDALHAFANYWAVHDGSGFSTEADRLMWAANRRLGVKLLVEGTIYRPQEVTLIFLDAARGQTYTLGAAPETAENIIAQWTAANSFEQFSQSYFNLWASLENMSIGN